ncbi:MAG TPA: hypothetical protein VHB77_11380, partial [Planctomycetaceae bacterium]|nr:hypothetical protein [Planctomycetaceae bacterium]
MPRSRCLWIAVSLLCLSPTVRAADAPAVDLKPIAPYIDDLTLVVAHIDLGQADLAGFSEQ